MLLALLLTCAPEPTWLFKEQYPVGKVIPWGENYMCVKEIRYNKLRQRKEYRLGDPDQLNRWPGFWCSARDVKRTVTFSPTKYDDPRIKNLDTIYSFWEENIK